MNGKEKLAQYTAELHESLWALAFYLYENPEIGFREYKSSHALTEFLKTHGFEQVSLGVGGLDTAFIASACPSGIQEPHVDILAEYDALDLGRVNGRENMVAHACGHNIIASTGVGAAVSLLKLMKEEKIPGTLRIVGTPAEENGGGKIILQNAGVFKDTDFMILLHPTSGTSKIAGRCKSIFKIRAIYHGRSAHAGNHREQGINAQDAAVICYTAIGCLRYRLMDDMQVFAQIQNLPDTTGIIPDYAEVSITARCFKKTDLDRVIPQIKNCVQAGALASGCSVEMEERAPYYGRVCYHTLETVLRKNFALLGEEILPGMVDDSGGEDFGNLIRKVPGIMPYPSLCLSHRVSLHTLDYLELVHSERAKEVVLLGSRVMAYTVLDVLQDASIILAAKAELAEMNRHEM